MKTQRLILFVILTLLVVAGAGYIARQQAPETTLEIRPLFPELPQQANRVARVELRDADNQAVIERRNGQWVLANRDGYPARVEMVKGLVVRLSQLRVLEGKTRNPKLYHRLQVEGTPEDPGKSVLLTLKDEEGRVLVDLVVGKSRPASALDSRPRLYVRLPQDPQSLLVEGELRVKADPIAWVEKDLFDISSSRIRRVEILHPDGDRVVLSREEPKKRLKLADIPAGKSPKSMATLQSLATALEEMRLWDVRGRERFPLPGEPVVATFTTFDGLKAVVRSVHVDKDKKYWATFDFMVDPQAQEKGKELDQELDRLLFHTRWVYELPTYKGEMLSKRMEDLLREENPSAPQP